MRRGRGGATSEVGLDRSGSRTVAPVKAVTIVFVLVVLVVTGLFVIWMRSVKGLLFLCPLPLPPNPCQAFPGLQCHRCFSCFTSLKSIFRSLTTKHHALLRRHTDNWRQTVVTFMLCSSPARSALVAAITGTGGRRAAKGPGGARRGELGPPQSQAGADKASTVDN